MKKATEIKGYKGFDKDLKCRDKQYALNSEFKEDKATICENGMHFCENPLDILAYYPAGTSRFTEVTGSGEISKKEDDEDTKVSCTEIKIGDELSLHSIIDAGVKFIFEKTTKTKVKHNTTDKKQSSNSGDMGAASNSGYMGAAFTIGNYSSAETNAEKSIAVAVGYDNKAKGNIGSWLVIAERNDEYEILDIKTIKVDGENIKENTFYCLKNGKITLS